MPGILCCGGLSLIFSFLPLTRLAYIRSFAPLAFRHVVIMLKIGRQLH
jgi:hypothetical protein